MEITSDVWFYKILDPSNNCYNLRAFVWNIFERKLESNQYFALRDMLDPKIKRVVYMSSRQSGKTEAIALFQAIFCMFPHLVIEGYAGKGNCYTFAPKLEQAQISFERFSNFVHFNHLKLYDGGVTIDNSARIQFVNGAEVRAITASRNSEIEGLTTQIIVLDECISPCATITYKKCKKYGKITIEELVNNKLDVQICCFNKNTNFKEYKKIINYFKKPLNSKKLYKIKIKTSKGIKEIKCTGEHKLMTDKGMIKAKDLNKKYKVQIK